MNDDDQKFESAFREEIERIKTRALTARPNRDSILRDLKAAKRRANPEPQPKAIQERINSFFRFWSPQLLASGITILIIIATVSFFTFESPTSAKLGLLTGQGGAHDGVITKEFSDLLHDSATPSGSAGVLWVTINFTKLSSEFTKADKTKISFTLVPRSDQVALADNFKFAFTFVETASENSKILFAGELNVRTRKAVKSYRNIKAKNVQNLELNFTKPITANFQGSSSDVY